MNKIINEFNREVMEKLEKGIREDDYHEIWRQLKMLKELKERVNLCNVTRC